MKSLTYENILFILLIIAMFFSTMLAFRSEFPLLWMISVLINIYILKKVPYKITLKSNKIK